MTFVVWFFITFVFIIGIIALIDGIKEKNKKYIKNALLLTVSPIILFIAFVIV